jgi:hypothetical protein
VQATPEDVDQRLVPMLRADVSPGRDQVVEWTARLVAECRDLLSIVLPLEPAEREFLDALNERGDIVPELLTDDAGLRALLLAHPGLRWKALNVRQHRGLEADEAEGGEP